MIFPEKRTTLADGSAVVLRSTRVEDAPVQLEYLHVTAAQTEFLVSYPEDIKLTVEDEELFIRRQLKDPDSIMIICEVDGRHAGNCSLTVKDSRIKTRHRGSIGIAIRKEFWNRGIGTLLMRELFALGTNMGLHQLELQVFRDNVRAIALYSKMGFEIVGMLPDAFCLKDGTFRDEYTMVRKLP